MEELEHPDGPRYPYTALTGEYVCCRRVEEYLFPDETMPFPLMGSHYHCPRCWAETGMYGHTSSICLKLPGPFPKNSVEFHRCCPDGYCELEEKKKSA